MRFFQTLFAGAALVAAAAALEINEFPKTVEPGKTYNVTYSPKDSTPTTFILRKGDNDNLDDIKTLTTTATGGVFQWTIDSTLPNAKDYALEIKQGSVINYIGPISLTGSDASAVVSSSTAAPSKTSSATRVTASSTATSAASASTGLNSTVSSATLSSTKPSSTAASTTTGGGVPQQSTGAASTLGSPVALFLGGFAAMVFFN